MCYIPRQWSRGFLVALGLLWLLLSVATTAPQAVAQPRSPIYLLDLEGVLSRYSIGVVQRALRDAETSGAEVLILRLGVDGAVLEDTRRLADLLVAAEVPVVVYVAPGGTRSGAAGVWLLTAAHIAAMAPNTSFGLTTPLVQFGPELSAASVDLLRNEVQTLLEERNRARGRSTDWITAAVYEGAVLNNEQASALNPSAVEIVARDLAELLTLLEGRVVTLDDGTSQTLRTLGRSAEPLQLTLWEWLLLTLATPTVAFMLLVMAGIAVYAEFLSPTIGALAGLGFVLLILAMIGLIALPVRWLAVLGVVIAFGLVAADIFLPSHGLVTLVGLVILVVSAMTMFDGTQAPGVAVALWAVLVVSGSIAAFAAIGAYLAFRSRQSPIATGQEGLLGRMAEVRKRLEPEGMVFVEGALWRAVSEDGEVEVGDYVRITGVYELRLTVRRLAAPPEPPA
ncbi:MAG: nodulation protein NfeD [Candidatus Viridilinea halotolerans]|uniref:Nodulation protein NfeD n=1 Tax=Candidatus Viridilinea halotolerans TaxID=2491704 RepID=A0A426TTD0_9CHLR|nr:MAG: nodulation protein NfeD [Candidatus Viridilinea halotolerans]